MPVNGHAHSTYTFPPAIEVALKEICISEGAILLESVIRGSNERRIVELYVDKPEGISLDECGLLSERIGELLEAEKVFPAAYRLEVSSPGVSRPLQFSWQFSRNIGRLLSFQTKNGETIKGRISGLSSDSERGDMILLEAPKATTSKTAAKKAAASGSAPIFPMEISLDDITNAIIEIEF